MKQSEFLAINGNLPKALGKIACSRWFWVCLYWLKDWHENFKLISKCGNCNHNYFQQSFETAVACICYQQSSPRENVDLLSCEKGTSFYRVTVMVPILGAFPVLQKRRLIMCIDSYLNSGSVVCEHMQVDTLWVEIERLSEMDLHAYRTMRM